MLNAPTINPDRLTAEALKHTVQEFPPEINAGAFLIGETVRGPILPAYGTKERDRMLRVYDQMEQNGLWQGAIAGLIKRVRSTPWEIKGDPYWANYYQAIFQHAQFGKGWGEFVSLVLRDYLTQDYGAFVELIGPGDSKGTITGPLGDAWRYPDDPKRYYGLAHKDAWRCYVTGNPAWPVVYYSLMSGALHRMHHSRIRRIVDMPNPDERYFGIGLCALSRCIGVAAREIRMGRYIDAFLDDKPKPGINVYSGFTDAQFQAAVKQYITKQSTDTGDLFGKVLNLFSMDIGAPLSVTSIPFAQTPEKFDFIKYVDLDVNAIALGLGVDRQDLWELAGRGLGSGSQSQILAQKSESKTYGDILQTLERLFNNDILPAGLEFRFKTKNTVGDTAQAAIDVQYAGVASSLATIPNMTTGAELRQMLSNKSQTFADAFTDEQGNIELDDSEVKLPGQEVRLDDDAPAESVQDQPIQGKPAPASSPAQIPAKTTQKGLETEGQRKWFFANNPAYSSSAVSETLPKLAEGYSYGKPIAPHELQKGDLFVHPGNAQHGRHEGTISKVNPKTIKYTSESSYGVYDEATKRNVYGPHTDEYSIPQHEAHGGYVGRGKVVHPVRIPGQKAKEFAAKDYQATRQEFINNIVDLVSASDQTSRRRFGVVFRAQLRRLGQAAFQDGLLVGGVTDPLDDDDLAQVQHWTISQSDYVSQFANDVYQKELTPAEIEQHAAMWANKSLDQMYQAGLMSADRNGVYEWILGQTEKHCQTCKRLEGQRHRFKQWYARGLLPKADNLDCGGWQCDCKLIKTTEPARGRF